MDEDLGGKRCMIHWLKEGIRMLNCVSLVLALFFFFDMKYVLSSIAVRRCGLEWLRNTTTRIMRIV